MPKSRCVRKLPHFNTGQAAENERQRLEFIRKNTSGRTRYKVTLCVFKCRYCGEFFVGKKWRDTPTRKISGVYFIKSGDFVKIGVSENIAKRLSQMQVHSPWPCEVVGVWRGKTAKEERRLHQIFHLLHLRGEWFRWDELIRQFIITYCDAVQFPE